MAQEAWIEYPKWAGVNAGGAPGAEEAATEYNPGRLILHYRPLRTGGNAEGILTIPAGRGEIGIEDLAIADPGLIPEGSPTGRLTGSATHTVVEVENYAPIFHNLTGTGAIMGSWVLGSIRI